MRTLKALSLLLVLAGCGVGEDPGPTPDSSAQANLTTAGSGTSQLTGCYAGPNGDDNQNIYRFEPNGVYTHLDTWNRAAGLPNTQGAYTLQNGVLQLESCLPAPVVVEAQALHFTANDSRWPAVNCADYSW